MTIPTLPYAGKQSSHVLRIKQIGLQQRNLTAVVIGLVFLHVIAAFSLYLIALEFAGAIYAMIIASRLLDSMGTTPARKYVTLVSLVIPIVNLVVIVVLNYKACEILRAAGLRVGLIGVDEHDLNDYSG
jgi:hypothetical protein